MKKKMSLVKLSKNSMKELKAGTPGSCYCGCLWTGEPGGSDVFTNCDFNFDGNLNSCRCGCSSGEDYYTVGRSVSAQQV